MHKFLIFVSIICLLALVGCAAIPATTALPPIQTAIPALPSQTTTTVPTTTATPSLPKPEQSSNLQPVNDAEEVFENGSWLVKNADGKVTATWDASTSKWVYNIENIQIVFGGATKPNSCFVGADSCIKGVTFTVPDIWETALPKDQIDPNPIVPLGFISQDGDTIDIGVDFRGIVFAEKAGTPVSGGTMPEDEYVAGFTVSDPSHPDMLYTITVPIADIIDNGIHTTYALVPNGQTDDPMDNEMLAPSLIKALQDPSTVGRRMALRLYVPLPGQTYPNFTYNDPNNQTLVDAIRSGQPISNIETSATTQALRVPVDIAKKFPNNY